MARWCYIRIHTDTIRYIQWQKQAHKRKHVSSNIEIPKICQHCGESFIAKTTVTQFCSHTCASRNYKKRKRDTKLQEVAPVSHQRLEFQEDQLGSKNFLSIEETCKLLGASRMTIYRQIKSGTIKAAKLGRRTIIRRTEIDKLFQAWK